MVSTYGANRRTVSSESLLSLRKVTETPPTGDFIDLLGDVNAPTAMLMVNDSNTWKGLITKNSLHDLCFTLTLRFAVWSVTSQKLVWEEFDTFYQAGGEL